MFKGSYTLIVEAETEEERDRKLDQLSIDLYHLMLTEGVDMSSDYEDTEEKWES